MCWRNMYYERRSRDPRVPAGINGALKPLAA
ncbi:hypothetical protein RSAG8_14007, partial [Rhizoctonia solani AG-8 WAC10335]